MRAERAANAMCYLSLFHQVYDAADNPIASQVNPIMSSNNIESTKYEVRIIVTLG